MPDDKPTAEYTLLVVNPRVCCWMCGHDFSQDEDWSTGWKENQCPSCHSTVVRDELIGWWDDCAWDQ